MIAEHAAVTQRSGLRIKQLKARYFRFVDEKKHDDLVALFTPDAKLVTDGIVCKSPQEFATPSRT
ncbi:nuclear transport factor 2 family protein [Streptomyces sp. PRKS01-29]|nr:nuclear transport factor 2 family protein [Streptomyces sabulosicollis]MBI0293348.1 nuclear transport factor 2 family protein [Streptomyces sabulosicollis]